MKVVNGMLSSSRELGGNHCMHPISFCKTLWVCYLQHYMVKVYTIVAYLSKCWTIPWRVIIPASIAFSVTVVVLLVDHL